MTMTINDDPFEIRPPTRVLYEGEPADVVARWQPVEGDYLYDLLLNPGPAQRIVQRVAREDLTLDG